MKTKYESTGNRLPGFSPELVESKPRTKRASLFKRPATLAKNGGEK